ncbi:MAG: rRNA pseudouridine synthase [Ruminococcaceae bacterium]|nr:rRNA pseudouridine synthase [Oscillospiraceae bacterium]
MERLDKTVAQLADMPRKQAVHLIRAGRVTVDGEVWRSPDAKLVPAEHTLTVAGHAIDTQQHRYYMLNKPQGVLCVSRDPKVPTVVDLVPPAFRRRGLFPAGRLDKDTVGLVVLTDDGDYAHRLLSPKKAVFKRYLAVVAGEMPQTAADTFAAGAELEDGTRCLPAKLKILSKSEFLRAAQPSDDRSGDVFVDFTNFLEKYTIPETDVYGCVEIAIQEGRYHQIKRMCEVVGHKVLWLKRISVGGLSLDPALAEGECRELNAEERAAALQSVEEFCAS